MHICTLMYTHLLGIKKRIFFCVQGVVYFQTSGWKMKMIKDRYVQPLFVRGEGGWGNIKSDQLEVKKIGFQPYSENLCIDIKSLNWS